MLTSLGFVILGGAALAAVCRKIQLPTIVGLMLAGLLLGPQGGNWLDTTMLTISPDLRQMALIVILVKAGLAINLRDIWGLGRPLLMMSIVPMLLELSLLTYLGLAVFGLHGLEALLLATAVCAVSPAVVVFRMIRLIELRYGTKKKIPQLIMVASSLEDIVVVVIFSLVLALVEAHVATPEGLSALAIVGQVPMALISGIVLGFIGGFILSFIAKRMSKGDELLPGTVTLILTILIAASFVMVAIGNWFKPYAAVSGLLAVMIMSSVVKGQVSYELGQALNRQINQLWIPIEIILFVLVGAAIDTTYMLSMSGILIGIIALGLIARMFGVGISLMKTVLSTKERL